MTPADDQDVPPILRCIAERHQGLPVTRLLQGVDPPDRNKRAAVDANELVAEFFFKVFERVIDQVNAICVVHANIFLIRMKIENIAYRNEL